ncbi:MAG TPA: hypothetical protein DCG42_16825 [Maribacter sp.]|nr:hypothetical protein [Maribacter sp.]
MSFWFIPDKFPTITPSTTNNGELLPKVPRPLIVIDGSEPGAPVFTTEIPAARPCKASVALATGTAFKSSDFTLDMAPVTAALLCAP